MNSDDPILTTYALGELDAEARAAVEEFLNEDFAALVEVEATRSFAANLRTQLQAEPAESLHASQRAAVFEALRKSSIAVVPFWRRPVLLSAAAACVIVGISIRLLWPVVNAPWKSNPQYHARQSAPTFRFTLDNGPMEFPREPLVPFISVSDEAPAQFMVSPPRIAFSQTPPVELPSGVRFLPTPRFAALGESSSPQFSPGHSKTVARTSEPSDGRRRSSWRNDSSGPGRQLVPERLGAFFPAHSEEQPAFSLSTTDYSHPLRLSESTGE